MACPHVAGTIALMRQADPSLTPDEIKDVLLNTAVDLGTAGEDNDYGKGIIDAYEAIVSISGGDFTRAITPSSYTMTTPFAQPVYRTLSIKNNYFKELTYEITSYSASWMVIDSDDLIGSVTPRSTLVIPIAFDPHSHEEGTVLTGNIVIETNDPNYDPFTIPCQLTVGGGGGPGDPSLVLSCGYLMNISLYEDDILTLDCRVTNDGGGVLEIYDVSENESWLRVLGLNTPVSINGGSYDEYDIQISARNLTPGQYIGEIVYDHNDPVFENPLHTMVILNVIENGYLPGDVNMYVGSWPPVVIGSDVNYLVNYFRGFPSSVPCYLDGFWASADVSGDCLVLGNDVTVLVNYFRGIVSLTPCPTYPPDWPTPDDLPDNEPPGWPNCD
jgi:hypothetical protein